MLKAFHFSLFFDINFFFQIQEKPQNRQQDQYETEEVKESIKWLRYVGLANKGDCIIPFIIPINFQQSTRRNPTDRCIKLIAHDPFFLFLLYLKRNEMNS
jgi:hypothetical protein